MWKFDKQLIGRRVRLEPLSEAHFEALREVAETGHFRFYVGAQPTSLEPGDWSRFLREIRQITPAAYAVLSRTDENVLGHTAFLDIRERHRGIEIGFSWLATAVQGTHVNPEMKLLMLRYAFEELGCIRVQLKCDARNAQSRAAILKLGATFEGNLRRHGIQPDGTVRDTAMFSITDGEWPSVESGLLARLAAE